MIDWLMLGEHLEHIKTLQKRICIHLSKSKKHFFILFLLWCFLVAVLYCSHLKWKHPNSVRTRKPNNCLGIDFAKGEANPTGERGQLWKAGAAQKQPGLQTQLGQVQDRGLSHCREA